MGKVDVSGEWLGNGVPFLWGNYFASSLDLDEGTLTIDTKSGYFSVEGGSHGTGVFNTTNYGW